MADGGVPDKRTAFPKWLAWQTQKAIDRARPLVRDVYRTIAFLQGQQWVSLDRYGVVTPIITKKVIASENIMAPTKDWWMGMYFKSLPTIVAHAGGVDLADTEAANVGGGVADYLRTQCGWLSAEREQCAPWVLATGVAYLAPIWRESPLRPTTVKRYTVTASAQGDEGEAKSFLQETMMDGFEADVTYDVYTPLNSYVLPASATTWQEVEAFISVQVATAAWLERTIGRSLPKDAVPIKPEQVNQALVRQLNQFVAPDIEQAAPDMDEENYLLVTYRERPNLANKNGRYVVMVGEQVIEDAPLPYIGIAREIDPTNSLNASMGIFPWLADVEPGRLIPQSPLAKMVPMQIAWNKLLTDMARNRQTVGRSKFLVEEGSISDEALTNEAGEVITYRHAVNPPQLMVGQGLPNLQLELAQVQQGIANVSGRNEIAQGRNIPNVRSGFQLDVIQEASQVTLEYKFQLREKFAEAVFLFSAAMLRTYGGFDKVAAIYGETRVNEVVAFMNCNLRRDLRVSEGSTLPRSKAGYELKLSELWRNNAFNPQAPGYENLWSMLRMGSTNPILRSGELAKARARNESAIMTRGQAVSVLPDEPHHLHIPEHQEYMNRPEFYGLDRAVQALHVFHVREHQNYLIQALNPALALDDKTGTAELGEEANLPPQVAAGAMA